MRLVLLAFQMALAAFPTAACGQERTVIDTDTEFDEGSGIHLASLTPRQADHLAVLGRVWGFLKYHHPRIAAGELHWDYELLRILPEVLEAPDGRARNRMLTRWVDSLGVPEACDPCAQPPQDVQLAPDLDWLSDASLLGTELSGRLLRIHETRFAGDDHFYVSLAPGVGNPLFEHEPDYASQRSPDAGFRILTLLRLWNIIEYWFPYRDQLDDDWPATLREFLPRFVAAAGPDEFRLETLALIARIGDTHANLWSDLAVRPPRGDCRWPVGLRRIEDRFVVTRLAHPAGRARAWDIPPDAPTGEEPGLRMGEGPGLRIGDVVLEVDGQPVDSLIATWLPYYAGSNRTRQLGDIALHLPQGACGESVATIRRGRERREVMVERVPIPPPPSRHDRAGDAFQLLSDDVAYLKLSSVKARDVSGYLRRAEGTRGLVIDIRNYPSEFVVFALGRHLVREPTLFARFTTGDLHNPGAFVWTGATGLEPAMPGYTGTVAILVDESSVSRAEYTAMAFGAAPGAVIVGSTTAGSDGNVSRIPLPGGMETKISGIGIFHPDRSPTQRVGIVPDIHVTPTIGGIRGGRDEVLEAALRHILGPGADEVVTRAMAARP